MADCGFASGDLDSRICRRRCDEADQQFELVCGPPSGTLDTGVVVPAGQNSTSCRSNFTINSATFGTYCSQPCVADADCPRFASDDTPMRCTFTSSTKCGTAGAGDPTGNAATFKFCQR